MHYCCRRLLLILVAFLGLNVPNIKASHNDCNQSKVGQGTLWIYKNLCLRIVTDHFSWDDARHKCSKRGGDLVQIRDAGLQTSIQGQLHKLQPKNTKFWIGATDRRREGHWQWASGDVSMPYTKWNPGQGPNQKGFLFWGGSIEDCALLDTTDLYQWHDYPCAGGPAFHYASICQYEMNPIVTSDYPATYDIQMSSSKISSTRQSKRRPLTTLLDTLAPTAVVWTFTPRQLIPTLKRTPTTQKSTLTLMKQQSVPSVRPRVTPTTICQLIPTKIQQHIWTTICHYTLRQQTPTKIRQRTLTTIHKSIPTTIRQYTPAIIRQLTPTTVRKPIPTTIRRYIPTTNHQYTPTIIRQRIPTTMHITTTSYQSTLTPRSTTPTPKVITPTLLATRNPVSTSTKHVHTNNTTTRKISPLTKASKPVLHPSKISAQHTNTSRWWSFTESSSSGTLILKKLNKTERNTPLPDVWKAEARLQSSPMSTEKSVEARLQSSPGSTEKSVEARLQSSSGSIEKNTVYIVVGACSGLITVIVVAVLFIRRRHGNVDKDDTVTLTDSLDTASYEIGGQTSRCSRRGGSQTVTINDIYLSTVYNDGVYESNS